MNDERLHALALQIISGVHVAESATARTGRDYRLCLTPDGLAGWVGCGTAPDGVETVHQCRAGDRTGDVMGLAKQLYTARTLGIPVPADTWRLFGGHVSNAPRPKRNETDAALVDWLTESAPAPAPHAEPAPEPVPSPARSDPSDPGPKPAKSKTRSGPAQPTWFD